MSEWKFSHCLFCGVKCKIQLLIEKDRIVKVKDALCPRGSALPQILYSPERLLHPLRKVGDQWEKISWNKAFNMIIGSLKENKKKYGSQSVAISFYRGAVFSHSNLEELVRRFSDLYGSCMFSGPSPMCSDPINMVMTYTFGTSHASPEITEKTRCIICWGANPYESNIGLYNSMVSAKKNGAKIIVIDPRSTPTAKMGDVHVKIRPGTDLALVLGLLHVIISNKAYDETFVERWTFGFNELKDLIKDFTPEKVERITQVPSSKIIEIAENYSQVKPSAIILGTSVWCQQTNNFQAIRGAAILISITGNLDVPGGNVFPLYLYPPISLGRLIDKKWGHRRIPISDGWKPGAEKFELYCDMFDLSIPQSVINAMINSKPFPIKAGIFFVNNPVLTLPNTKKVKKALKSLDFLVVKDFIITETAKLADLVLPTTYFPESPNYIVGSKSIAVMNKIVDPPGECLGDVKFWLEIGKRMGYEEYFPWKTETDYLETLLKPLDITLEKASEKVIFDYPKKKLYRKYEGEGFRTFSGKVEFYSKFLKNKGISPLPVYCEPAESQISKKELTAKYPLILITGSRKRAFRHSQFRHIPFLRKDCPENILEINPKDAKKYGVTDGDLVFVESPRGKIKLKSKYADILEGVVSMMHGWPEANANILTDDAVLNPVTGSPGCKSVLCRIERVKEEK